MATWPKWGRWTFLVLTYVLLGSSFWLMFQGALLRVIGLLVFALAVPLIVRSAQAMARERYREGDRRFMREFLPAMVIYMVAMLYVWPLQKGMAPGLLKTALVLSPMLPISWAILASIRHVLSSDELERRQHLEAAAMGVAIVSVVSLALGLLSAAKILVLDSAIVLLMVYPALCLTYGAARCFLVWRAHRE